MPGFLAFGWHDGIAADLGRLVPSLYARMARCAGLDIITWTFERTDTTDGAKGDWYTAAILDDGSIEELVNRPGDGYEVPVALASKVGVLGVFSDLPAAVTYYADCMGLR